jgi:hypothetical protein
VALLVVRDARLPPSLGQYQPIKNKSEPLLIRCSLRLCLKSLTPAQHQLSMRQPRFPRDHIRQEFQPRDGRVGERTTLKVRTALPSSNRTCGFPASGSPESASSQVYSGSCAVQSTDTESRVY